MKKLFFILSIVYGLWSPFSIAHASYDDAKSIPIQHNGRIKPLDSFARQTLKLVAGKESWQGKTATNFLLGLLSSPESISKTNWIRIDLNELKKYLKGLAKLYFVKKTTIELYICFLMHPKIEIICNHFQNKAA